MVSNVSVLTDHGTTVLIVDDEPPYADAHARMLADRYDVHTAYSGEAALEMIDEFVDVLLIDRRMPRRSGEEVIEELHERGIDCRTIVLSAIDPRADAVEVPIDDYLRKPVEKGELRASIDRVLC